MPYSVGIVGLTNAGKSTVFSALTSIQVPCEAYPFCTIDPNRGMVAVPDERLEKLTELIKPEKTVPAVIEFVDIAGLVRGAHKGEGLGNQFLAEIRAVDAIAEVIRCFENPEVSHPDGSLDPVRDAETITFELIQKDLETAEKRLEKAQKMARVGDKTLKLEMELCQRMKNGLEQLNPLDRLQFHPDEEPLLNEIKPLTLKKKFFIANLGEEALSSENQSLVRLRDYAEKLAVKVAPFFGKVELEVHELDKSEQEIFLKGMGIERSGLSEVIRAGKEVLDLITFYTVVGGKELRNWLVPRGTSAPKAAGKIHTDFEQGFIKAEVTRFEDFIKVGGEAGARKEGLARVEGKEYLVQDGDIIHFRFKV